MGRKSTSFFILLLFVGLLVFLKFKIRQRDEIKNIPASGLSSIDNGKNSRHDKNDPGNIPVYVLETLHYIRQHHETPNGYVGGREFKNREGKLKKRDGQGNRIIYLEWDVHPKSEQHNRGAERLVTGSDESAWYTHDHYNHFTEIKE